MRSESFGKNLTISGTASTALGILGGYLGEDTSLDTTTRLYSVLEFAFELFYLAGLLFVIVGSIVLMVKGSSVTCLRFGGWFLGAIVVAVLAGLIDLVTFNPHDWTVALMVPLIAIFPLGVALLVASGVKGRKVNA